MALPKLDHLTFEDFRHIYEPSDDTFLLVDALEADRRRISDARPAVCVEVG
jgi:release factor glutamine methyltransferase